MTEATGNLVIYEENMKEFYDKVASIKDQREITFDYQVNLRTPGMENYLIGDMGTTFNAIGKIKSRQEKLKRLKERITE